ncbi:MAG: ThiF family adenylyltransferase [Bacilli bacterium]|nr:ThiF family adenylyltransferase [Bacilli bacterium]MBR0301762.1 ThiF family adenylyltransferase [Bacilli bacterium]
MASYLDRTETLLGKEKLERIQKTRIMVIGLGGVGGTALSALYRSGFRHFVLVDNDKVDPSNLNRQIMYTNNDVGKLKTDVCKTKITEFCGEIDVKTINLYVDEVNSKELIKDVDFVVDAIDFVPGKIGIMKACLEKNIPFISSLGMAKRLDPEQVIQTTLNKTENDPLAKKIRYECRQRGLDLKKIPVVFSKENIIIDGKQLGSMMMVPSTAGLIISNYIIKNV